MILRLVLWLCCFHFTNQEICSSSGNLRAPQLLLGKTSSEEEDTVVLKCKVPPLSTFSRVIFCKDGKDHASWPMQESKFAYDYKVRANSVGRFTCLYQHKDSQNQEKNSLQSATQSLSVTDETPTSNRTSPLSNGLILGITIPSFLLLVVVCSLLVKKVLSKWRDTREQSPSEESAKSPGDRLEYAITVGFGRANTTHSQPSRDMAMTHTTVGHCTAPTAGHLPAGETEYDIHPYCIGFGL